MYFFFIEKRTCRIFSHIYGHETSVSFICISRVSKCFDLSVKGDCFMCTISPTYQSTSQANVSPWKILRLSVRRQTPRGRDTLTAALKVLPSVAEHNTQSQTVMLHFWPLFPVSCPKRAVRQFREIVLNWDSIRKRPKQEATGERETHYWIIPKLMLMCMWLIAYRFHTLSLSRSKLEPSKVFYLIKHISNTGKWYRHTHVILHILTDIRYKWRWGEGAVVEHRGQQVRCWTLIGLGKKRHIKSIEKCILPCSEKGVLFSNCFLIVFFSFGLKLA